MADSMPTALTVTSPAGRRPFPNSGAPSTRHQQRLKATPTITGKKYGMVPMPVDLIRKLIRNPDELFQKDVHGYDKVMANPFVQSEFFTMISPIVEADRTVEGYGNVADALLSTILNALPGLENAMEQLLYAYITGVRYIEIIWGVANLEGLKVNMPVEFAPHDTHRFARDEAGFLWMTQDGNQGFLPNRNNLTHTVSGQPIFIAPRKMLIHKYRDGDGRFGYGHGEGRNLFRLTEFMNAVLEWWADACQTGGRPVKVLYVDKDVIQEAIANSGDTGITSATDFLRDEMDRIDNMIENDTYATDGRNRLETVQLGTSGQGKSIFMQLYGALGDMIRLHISGELMTSSDGGGKGSFALSKTHANTQAGRRGRLSRGLATTLHEMVRWIIHFNQGYFRSIPSHARGKVRILTPMFTPQEQLALAKEMGLEVLKSDVFKIVGMSEPTPEQINAGLTVKLGGASAPMPGAEGGFGGFGI